MKSWALDQLESSVPESIWLEAEALIDRQAIRDFEHENEKFSARVISGSETFSTSAVLKKKNLLTEAHCDCDQFTRTGQCAHFVAFALNARTALTNKKVRQSNVVFDMELIGKEIPFPDLWTFVRQYAKKDKFLEWQMKARFARHIPSLHQNKYRKLFEQVLPPSQEAKKRKPVKRFRQTIQIIKILRDEALDALALNEYMEAFLIAEACLPKLCILLRDQETTDPVTLEIFNYFIEFVRKLYEQPIPNALRERIIEWGIDLSCRSYFPNKRSHDNLYYDLAEWIEEKDEYWDSCTEHLTTKYNYACMVGQEVAFIAQSHSLLNLIDQANSAYPWLEKMKDQLDKGQQLIHYSQYHLTPERAAPLFKQMAEVWKGTTLERIIHESLFQVFSQMSDPKAKKFWAKQLLREKFIPRCYDALVNNNGKEGQDIDPETFEEWMKNDIWPALNTNQRLEYEAEYLAHLGKWKSLKALISHSSNALVRRFDQQLFENAKEEATDLYQGILIDYLKDHHGPSASHFLSQVRQRLIEIDALEYWKDITEKVLEIYGDRSSVLTGISDS